MLSLNKKLFTFNKLFIYMLIVTLVGSWYTFNLVNEGYDASYDIGYYGVDLP